MHILDELAWRGLVAQSTDEAKLRDYLNTPGRGLYCGFDPTAPSLHVGNLVPLITLMRFARAGHAPIFLMGGGTALIGDPSGKDAERTLQTRETIEASAGRITEQVKQVFGNAGLNEGRFVSNIDWIGETSAIDLLREVGKYFTVNWMLQKESVKNRIERDDVGISFTEFSYMLLQGWDFSVLAEREDCKLQIGGSDQWGNITAGTELIRKKLGQEAYGLTLPLITTAEGKKFGKSESGAIYLDPALTSVYDFYQFWVRVDDRDVIGMLKYFTFLAQADIAALETALAERPEMRVPQKRLAAEMTALVHGEDELAKVVAASEFLYGKSGADDLRSVDPGMLKSILAEAPSAQYANLEAVPEMPQVLLDLGLVKSKGQARKDITAGGIYVNQERVRDLDFLPAAEDLIHGQGYLVRKGKKNYALVWVGAQ